MKEIIENLDIHTKGFWIPIIWTGILLLVVLLIPKVRMNWVQIYCTYGAIGALTWIANSIFGIYLDLVTFGSSESTGLAEMLTYALIPASLAVVYLNKLKEKRHIKRTAFFLVLSLFVEWTCHASGFMEYNHWNLLYSVPVYFIVYYFFLPLHYKIIKSVSA